jgi:hypothetical protein
MHTNCQDCGVSIDRGPRGTKRYCAGCLQLWASALRDLTEDELSSAAARRFFIAEIERLQNEVTTARRDSYTHFVNYDRIRVECFNVTLEKTRLEGRVGISIKNELLSYITVAAGSAGIPIGFELSKMPAESSLSTTVLIVSAILLVCGIVLRTWHR